jgi:2-oxoglutarate ferredoxin oxidoreductase subunit beta
MASATTPENTTTTPAAKPAKVNRIGLGQADYRGLPSTLCKGCGHDSITSQIINSFWEMGIEPYRVAKMSGIGCSSKTTAYFLDRAHGFNSVHGRMGPITTGSHMANRSLVHVGVSGDGDTASIGLGNFLHLMRRNVPIVYLIENNGVYGLTKGQFSATADRGSKSKGGVVNDNDPIDCCALAITMGCEYVARSFSGDFKQLNTLLKGAIAHGGAALIDVVSPCITFNNHEGSTKSLAYAKEHETPLHEVGFVPYFEPITAEVEPGEIKDIALPDGSHLRIKQLEREYDPTNKQGALALLDQAKTERMFLTGLIYAAHDKKTITEQLNLTDIPLAQLPESVIRPSSERLAELMEELR